MFGDEGACRQTAKSAAKAEVLQFQEGILEGPVAVDGYQYGPGPMAMHPLEVVGHQEGHPAGIDGHADDDHIGFRERQVLAASPGQGQVMGQGLEAKPLGDRPDHLGGPVGGAEIERV